MVEERCAAWLAFRDGHRDELRQKLHEQGEVIRDGMRELLEHHRLLVGRWQALDPGWAAVERATYRPGTTVGGDLPPFPITLTGSPAAPAPRVPVTPRRVTPAAQAGLAA